MKGEHKREIFIGLLMLALAALGWFAVIPAGIDLPRNIKIQALSPDFWPRIVMGLLAAAGAAIAIQGFFESREPDRAAEADIEDAADDEVAEHAPAMLTLRVVLALAALFVFYAGIEHLGIVACSMAIIVVFTYALGQRQWKFILPLAVLLPLVLYFFFVHVASIPMPLGVFEQFR